MAKITYDQEFKKVVIEESLKNGLGYKRIASKYNIAIATARNWILKAREFNNSSSAPTFYNNNAIKLVDVTDSIKQSATESPHSEERYELEINGSLLKMNFSTLKAIIEVLKND